MNTKTIMPSETRIGVAIPKAAITGVFTTALFFNMNVSVHGQANPQTTWQAVGSDSVRTSRFVDVNNNFRANNTHILFNAQIDSILRAMQTIVDNTLSVGSDITIGGNGSIAGNAIIGQGLNVTGQTQTGSLLVNQNSILGFAEAFKFTADSIIAAHISATEIFAGTIDAGQYLLNGLPLVSSLWVSSGSNIYYTGGNVGIGTNDPQKALHVLTFHNIPFSLPPPIPVPPPGGGSHYGIRLEDQTTTHPTKIDQVTNITIWDIEPTGGNLIIGTPGSPKMTLSETGVGIGKEPGVALDVAGDVRASGSVTANSLNMNGNLQTSGKVIASAFAGSSPLIFEAPVTVERARIDDISGNLGIGTTNPGANLHVNGTFKLTNGTQQPGFVLTSDADGNATWQANGNDGNGTSGNDGNWTRPGGDIMYNTNLNDNVGIGLTNPIKKLHIKTTHGIPPCPNPPCPVGPPSETGSHNGIRLEDEDFATSDKSIWDIEPVGKTGKLHIGNANDTVMTFTGGDNADIQLTNKVGIGLTNPLHHLHIHSNKPLFDDQIHHECCGIEPEIPGIPPQPVGKNFVTMQLTNLVTGTGESDGMLLGVLEKRGFLNLQEDDDLFLVTKNGNINFETNNTIRMNINSTGNVGIGTISPGAKFEIFQNSLGESGALIRQEKCGTCKKPSPVFEIRKTLGGVDDGTLFIVEDSGSVGIGTASPIARFHVAGGNAIFDNEVGIGTTSPATKLEVNGGGVAQQNGIKISNYVPTLYFKNQVYQDGHDWHIAVAEVGSNATLAFKDETANAYRMIIDGNGNVGIGTTSPQAKLHIEVLGDNEKAFVMSKNGTNNVRITGDGRVFARKFRATLDNIPDYVFSDDYPLMSIPVFGEFIYKYKHLPNFKSAKEEEENGGVVDLGERISQFHELLEIYGRYIVSMDKRVTELEKQNESKDNVIKEKDKKIITLEKENDLLKNRK